MFFFPLPFLRLYMFVTMNAKSLVLLAACCCWPNCTLAFRVFCRSLKQNRTKTSNVFALSETKLRQKSIKSFSLYRLTIFLQGLLRVPHWHSAEHSTFLPLQGHPRLPFYFLFTLQELLHLQHKSITSKQSRGPYRFKHVIRYAYLTYRAKTSLLKQSTMTDILTEPFPTFSEVIYMCAKKMRKWWHSSFKLRNKYFKIQDRKSYQDYYTFCAVRKIINLYKIFFLTLRNIILKYKTEKLTKIILLFCPVRKIINLYKICILMLRKKILQNKIIWSSSIKKTGYIENVSIWFFIKVTI